MKLAEALILRADCKKRIVQLKSRLLTNAKVQEGEAPAEIPDELITELGRVSTELLDLIKRINKRTLRREVLTAPRCRWQNAYVERFIGLPATGVLGSHNHLQ